MKNVGNAHLVDQGMTNWPVTTLRLVRHRWLGIGYVAWGVGMWGYTPVGITGVQCLLVQAFSLPTLIGFYSRITR